jgi:5-methylcytosine-specific restriction endonuclease McrA
LPASFAETKNYIFSKTQSVFYALSKHGISADNVLKSIREVISWDNSSDTRNREDLFNYDFVYYDSFFVKNKSSIEFLALFNNSSTDEKQEFKAYIVKTVRNLKENSVEGHHILSKKYVSGGVYTKLSLIEDAWLLYVTYSLINAKNISSFEQFIDIAIKSYSELFKISGDELFKTNDNNLRKFIFDSSGNRSVFQIIFCELYNFPVSLNDVAKDLTPEEIEKYATVDPTDAEGYKQREVLASTLKKLAKQHANYKCECGDIEACRYFKAKETGQHYLEIHHFIPREFANDFDTSIEIIENYIALCPNCHRKIHLAEDGERKHLIISLFNQRKSKLQSANLNINLEKMFEYYKIDNI